jgi:YaiO family outer membrane protein
MGGPLAASAQTAELPTSVELGYGRESLSNDSPDWQDTGVDITHRFDAREYLGFSLHDVKRFGVEDVNAAAFYLRPLTERLAASIEGSLSPGASFLARSSLAAGLQYEFAPAWLLHGGLRAATYAEDHVTEGALKLERYVSDFSWSVGWKPVHALGSYAQSFEVRGSYYYGARNMVGVIAAYGREATSVAPDEVVLADVRSIALLGRHHVTERWALTYAITRVEQGTFYTRTGGRLGVQYSF